MAKAKKKGGRKVSKKKKKGLKRKPAPKKRSAPKRKPAAAASPELAPVAPRPVLIPGAWPFPMASKP